jgi:hypothetical protein
MTLPDSVGVVFELTPTTLGFTYRMACSVMTTADDELAILQGGRIAVISKPGELRRAISPDANHG